MTAPARPTAAPADRIIRLFLSGNSLDRISEQGAVSGGWTRADAEAVAAQQGWRLDDYGRIPTSQRQQSGPPPAFAPRQPAPHRLPRQRGGPYVAALNAGDLFVDATYQRPLDAARVKRMVDGWIPRMIGVLDVSDRGAAAAPRYAVINGQHRLAAARQVMGASPWLVCNVHEGLTPQLEADLMYELDRGTKPLSSWEKWRARSVAGDPHVLAVEQVAAAHNMRVEPTIFGAVGAAEQLVRRGGRTLLEQTVGALVAAYGPSPAAVKAPLLTAVGALFHSHGSELDAVRLIAALQKSSPQQLRASGDSFREVEGGTLSASIARLIAGLYNRLPGPRIASDVR